MGLIAVISGIVRSIVLLLMQWNHWPNLGPAPTGLSVPAPMHGGSLPPPRLHIDRAACHACCQLQLRRLSSDPTLVSECAIEEAGVLSCRGIRRREISASCCV